MAGKKAIPDGEYTLVDAKPRSFGEPLAPPTDAPGATLVDDGQPGSGFDDAATVQRIERARPSAPPTSSGPKGQTPPDTVSHPRQVDASPALLDDAFTSRYTMAARLGFGGMGEVRQCRDQRIGRDVAMKVIREGVGSRSDIRSRFEREARVQGQLEHPSIVPVYDLGVTPSGDAFFTMKRVKGHSLDQLVRGLRKKDKDITERYGQTRKLLTAFRQVCLAIAFAHSRGVLHRDLKPANIMLGDFGEVYVLDWGLAKVAGTDDPDTDSAIVLSGSSGSGSGATPISSEGDTVRGAVVGTPGYMPPEQVRSAATQVDERADIYALGAILFELLTQMPLHNRTGIPPERILVETLNGVEARPSVRAPDKNVPPELEAIVVKATAFDPEDRFHTVTEMVDAIERFLDGDRDAARRQELAEKHAEAAAYAVDLARAGGERAKKARAEAIREVNRALALDPTHAVASSILVQLFLEPPTEVPKEAEADLKEELRKERRTTSGIGGFAYLSWFVVGALMLWQGIKSWPVFVMVASLVLASALLAWLVSSQQRSHTFGIIAVLVTSTAAIGLSAGHFGPFLLIPGLAAANTLVLAMNIPKGGLRGLAIGIGAMGVAVPVALELLHVIPASWSIQDDTLRILPRLTHFSETLPTTLILVVSSIFMVVVPSLVVARLRDQAIEANRKLLLQQWHLRQFLPRVAAPKGPGKAQRSSTPPPAR